MKKIIAFLFFCSFCNAQETDQLDQLYKQNKIAMANIENIQLNLREHHKVYRTGIGLGIAGGALSVLGIFLQSNEGLLLAGVGSLVSISGVIVTIRSHRYIGRAGQQVDEFGNPVPLYMNRKR